MADYSKYEFEEIITDFTHEVRIRFPNRTKEKPIHMLYRGSSALVQKINFILGYAAGVAEQNGIFEFTKPFKEIVRNVELKVKGRN